jgi:hypothetical protein
MDRGRVLYRENRPLFGIKNRMFLKYILLCIFVEVLLASYFFYAGEIPCLAPIAIITLFLIGVGFFIYRKMSEIFTIYEKGIQFSDSYVGYVPFNEIKEIKFGITKRNLAKYIVVKKKEKGSKNITIAGNDYRTAWELTNDVDNIREILIPHWNEMNGKEEKER